jgi:hemoglobin/transferrin/lactoferrin receptor protein
MFGYTAIANPDLKPETSDGLEAGLRFSGYAVYASVSAYYNRYEDFIESMRFIGFNDDGLMVYQSQNIAEAKIHGVELKAGVDFGALSDKWQGWSLRGAAAWSRGEGKGPEEVEVAPDVFEERIVARNLDSVDPLTATLGVAYQSDAWGAELAGRFVQRKDRVSDPSYYQQGGYGVLDLYAHWEFAPGARFNLGIFNLADRKYSEAGDVPVVNGSSTTLDRYTSPGRNLSASLSVNW